MLTADLLTTFPALYCWGLHFKNAKSQVRAISDVCLHRAASLSDGFVDGDSVVCPYHAYKFDGNGRLSYIPGVDESLLRKNKRVARTVWYKTLEQAG
jgi:phenylpropionate dioxygenase-like ring-hydroxylating dioxygenase large terminal subunit